MKLFLLILLLPVTLNAQELIFTATLDQWEPKVINIRTYRIRDSLNTSYVGNIFNVYGKIDCTGIWKRYGNKDYYMIGQVETAEYSDSMLNAITNRNDFIEVWLKQNYIEHLKNQNKKVEKLWEKK